MTDRGDAMYEILKHVRPIVLNSGRVVEAEVRRRGWTVGSRAVMEILCRQGPVTVPAVADQLSLARQNVQRHINELIDLGDVVASANPRHRRSVLVQPTKKGRSTFQQVHEHELADLDRLAPGCTDTQLATTASVLAAMAHDIRHRATETTESTTQ